MSKLSFTSSIMTSLFPECVAEWAFDTSDDTEATSSSILPSFLSLNPAPITRVTRRGHCNTETQATAIHVVPTPTGRPLSSSTRFAYFAIYIYQFLCHLQFPPALLTALQTKPHLKDVYSRVLFLTQIISPEYIEVMKCVWRIDLQHIGESSLPSCLRWPIGRHFFYVCWWFFLSLNSPLFP